MWVLKLNLTFFVKYWSVLNLIEGCNLIPSDSYSRCCVPVWVGRGQRSDEQTTTSVQADQAVTVMSGTSFGPIDKSAFQKCFIFSCFTRSCRSQLPKLCHATSHAHWPAVCKVLLWPWGYHTVCKTSCASCEKRTFSERIWDVSQSL